MGQFWSARIGLRYRALAKERSDGLVWFWIGPHGTYDHFDLLAEGFANEPTAEIIRLLPQIVGQVLARCIDQSQYAANIASRLGR